MSLAFFLQLVAQSTLTDDEAPFGPDPLVSTFPFTQFSFVDGDGTDEANTVGILTITIPANGDVTVDLASDLRSPRDGYPVTFTNIKFFGAMNAADPEEDPWANIIGGDATSFPWENWTTEAGAMEDIPPGSPWIKISRLGYTLDPAVGSSVKFANPNTSGEDLTVHIMAAGVSDPTAEITSAVFTNATNDTVLFTFSDMLVSLDPFEVDDILFTGGNPTLMTVVSSSSPTPTTLLVTLTESAVSPPTTYNFGTRAPAIRFTGGKSLDPSDITGDVN